MAHTANGFVLFELKSLNTWFSPSADSDQFRYLQSLKLIFMIIKCCRMSPVTRPLKVFVHDSEMWAEIPGLSRLYRRLRARDENDAGISSFDD